MGQQYSAPHFKTHSRNIEFRCQSLTNKRNQEIRQWEKKICSLLQKNLDESARLECLQMLRYERYIVCYKLFTLAGRTLTDSVGIITKAQTCPYELLDACCCIIFAAERFSEVSELKGVTEQLYAKFGEEWIARVRKNKDKNVNPQLLRAMTDPNPIKDDMIVFLRQLSKRYNVTWEPQDGYEAETLGCMKMFPPHHMDDGTTDIYIRLDDEEELATAAGGQDEGGEIVEEEPPAYEDQPQQIQQPIEPIPTPQPEKRGPYYYIDPNPPARYDPPVPVPQPTPQPVQQPTPQPVQQPVVQQPVPQPQPTPQPTPQPSPVAAYPALAPQQSPVAAYPALAPQQSPVAGYPAQQQQQQQRVAAYPAMAGQTSPQSQNHQQQQQYQQSQQHSPHQQLNVQVQPHQQQQQQQQSPQSGGEQKDAATLALERRLAMLNAGR